MNNPQACACATAPKLIFTCSGAADVGEITDRTARALSREGTGKMYCLAGIGGRVSGIVETTKAAAAVLAIDGCPQDCARKTLALAGFTRVAHLRLADLGMKKGASPLTEARVAAAAAGARELLQAATGGSR